MITKRKALVNRIREHFIKVFTYPLLSSIGSVPRPSNPAVSASCEPVLHAQLVRSPGPAVAIRDCLRASRDVVQPRMPPSR